MTDELMLRRARNGDAHAFEELITPLEGQIWRLCWHYMGNREDAQDAAQETMLKAWRSLSSFRGDSKWETWVYRLCVNCCLDALRKRKLRRTESADALQENGFDAPDDAPRPDEQVLNSEHREELREALSALPEEQRTALILSAVEGKSYEDVADITGVAVGTVKSRINRARTKLMEMLKKREQNDGSVVQMDERRAQG